MGGVRLDGLARLALFFAGEVEILGGKPNIVDFVIM